MTDLIVGIVPANDLSSAKSRLKGFLSNQEREELVIHMLRRVVGALLESAADATFVISRDPVLQREAEILGAVAMGERGNLGPSLAVDTANQAAMAQGCDATLVLLSDLPAVKSHDVDEMIKAGFSLGRGVVACRSIRGGTNALWRMPPGIIPSRYGENSFINHREEAEKAGVPFRQAECERISLDLDTPEDVNLLLRHAAGLGAVTRLLQALKTRMEHEGKEDERWQDQG